MSKRLSLVAALLVGLVIGFTPYIIHKYEVAKLGAFTEQLGCQPLPSGAMDDTPTPDAKGYFCPMSGLMVAIV